MCEHVCLLCFFFGSFSSLVFCHSLICLFLIIIVLCCIVLLFLIILIIIVCFLRRETKAMNLDGRGDREKLGGIGGEETIIRKYLMKKTFSKKNLKIK